jgi:hypothetical protein
MDQGDEEGLSRDSWTDEAVMVQQVVQLPDCQMVMMTMTTMTLSSLELNQNAMAVKNHTI